jgi:nicotinamide mononucleotide transporter
LNTVLELVAVGLGIAYLLLAVREQIACWYTAFVSTAIFLYLFWDVRLLMESGLQVYYLAMAVYGWLQWRNGGRDHAPLRIHAWRWQQHAVAVVVVLSASLLSGLLLERYTDARLPFVDSFTTWGSIVTTWMVARKVLENWLYWLVIDAVSIFLYLDRGLYFTAALFAAYLVIAVFGWYQWHRVWRAQQAGPAGG